jgi:hypothetical protein
MIFEKKNTTDSSLAMTAFNKGVYLVKISEGTKSWIKKIIIN